MAPLAYLHNPANCIATKFVHTSTNIARCPINVVTVRCTSMNLLHVLILNAQWTPEGRRLITGNSSGEFTLWNGSAFNFETIMQVRSDSKAIALSILTYNFRRMIVQCVP